MIVKKELKRVVKGNMQTITYDYHKKRLLSEDELQELRDLYDDDAEEAYYNGVFVDLNGDICAIDIDSLIGALQNFVDATDQDERTTAQYVLLYSVLRKIKKWSGYTIYTDGDAK